MEVSNFATFSLFKIMIVGGYHGRIDENMGISSDVWYFMDTLNPNYEVTLLNSLNEPRMEHSCGIMRKNKNEDKFIAVVAGGYNGFKSLDSVEILEFDKGSLISESFSFWLKSPKKGAKSLSWALSTKRENAREWFDTYFWRFEHKWQTFLD